MSQPEPTARSGHPDVDSGVWPDPDDDPRSGDVVTTDERSTLLAYLAHHRLTMELKCAGLDAEQLSRRSVPPSPMSLLGLVRHLADVERNWFRRQIGGGHEPDVFRDAARPDDDFDGVTPDPVAVVDAFRVWRSEIANSDRVIAGVTDLSVQVASGVQIRDILVHMVEEYARHCGHADLLRESIDGRTGQ